MDYQKVYTRLIFHRKSKPLEKSKGLYTELHHILPRCLGGSDEPENLVRLTAREHFIAHRLLAKIHFESPNLALAVLLMSGKADGVIISKHFAELRRRSSEIIGRLWEDPSFRSKMEDLHRRKASEQWKQENFRNKMKIVLSETAKKRWEDKLYRSRMSTQSRELHRDKEFISKKEDGYKNFLETNPWPWSRPTGISKKHIWTLAASFYILWSEENYRYPQFIREFLCDKHVSIFRRMENMFKEGWNPLECESWLEEFKNKM